MSAENVESKETIRARLFGADKEVPCTVFPGLFPSEICIQIKLPNGKSVCGFFDKVYASWEGELTDEGVQGRFGVRTIEEDKDTVLVEFTSNPGQHLSLSSSPRARIPKDFLLPIFQTA